MSLGKMPLLCVKDSLKDRKQSVRIQGQELSVVVLRPPRNAVLKGGEHSRNLSK